MRRRPLMGPPWSLVVTLCVAALVAGCTGDGSPDPAKEGSSTPSPRPPVLTKKWQLRTGNDAQGGSLATWTWRSGKVLTVLGETSVTGHNAKTGRTLWSLQLPDGIKRICAVSEETNTDGVGGLLLAGNGGGCSVAAAIDTGTGKLLWKQSMGRQDDRSDDFAVSVGEANLTASVACDEVRRFDLSSGKPLHTYVSRDDECANDSAHNGQLIAVLSDPATKDTRDDHGTGLIPPHDGTATFKLYDADSGKLRWRRKVNRRGAALNGIVHAEPLILDTTVRGHRLMRLYGQHGEPGAIVGKALSDLGDGPRVLGAADGVLMMTYESNKKTVYGYDLKIGNELWARRLDRFERPLGLQHGGLLQVRQVDYSGVRGPSLVITRHDARDPQRVTTLGRIPVKWRPLRIAWDDHRLYVHAHGRLRAYELPVNGEVGTHQPSSPAGQARWADSDIRPAAVIDACGAVSPQTLELMGFRSSHLPPTAGCSWRETHEPEYVRRHLNITVTAARPVPGQTAVGHARDNADALRERMGEAEDDRLDGARPVEIDGLGDRAWMATASVPDGSHTHSELLVRYRNVTVHVDAEVKTALGYLRDQTTPRHLVEGAVLQAASEVLHRIGAPVSPPERASEGSYTRVRNVCDLLDKKVPGLTPKGEPDNLSPASESGRRQTGCFWSAGDTAPRLTVAVYAVPGSAPGHSSARQVARSIFENVDGVSVPNMGDEAVLDRFSFEKGESRTHTLTARADNLLVTVEYERWHHPPRKQLDADVKHLARLVLDAQHR